MLTTLKGRGVGVVSSLLIIGLLNPSLFIVSHRHYDMILTAVRREEEVSLAYTRRAGTEARRNEGKRWLETVTARRTLRACRAYRVTKGFKPDPAAAAAPKAIVRQYYQSKIGHAAVGAYLHKAKPQEDQACQRSEARTRQSTNHLLFECREWRVQRRALRGDLIRVRVQYPTAVEDIPDASALKLLRGT
jgi:hypothetical protein